MKAMIIHDDTLSTPIDKFEDHCVLVFDLTSAQDVFENCHYPELVGEPSRLIFTFPLQYVAELIVLGNECLRLQMTSLVLLEK